MPEQVLTSNSILKSNSVPLTLIETSSDYSALWLSSPGDSLASAPLDLITKQSAK